MIVLDPKTQKLVINITEDGGKKGGGETPDFTPALGFAPNYVPRPLRRKKKRRKTPGEGFIFYDLGQVKSGEDFVTLPFQFIPEAVINTTGTGFVSLEDFDIARRNALLAKFLEIPVGQWSENYKPIGFDEGYAYGIDVYFGTDYGAAISDAGKYFSIAKEGERYNNYDGAETTGEGWEEDGLKITEEYEAFSVYAAYGFTTFDFSYVKITSEADYAADAVTDFKFKGKTEVYLVPQIFLEQYFQKWSDPSEHQDTLNAIFGVLPREFWLNADFAEEWRTYYGGLATPLGLTPSVIINESLAQQIVTNMKSRDGSRLLRYDFGTTNGYTLSGDTFTLIRSGAFTAIFYLQGELIDNFNESGLGKCYTIEGSLVAVVKTNGRTFYFWANDTLPYFPQMSKTLDF